jgi:hypothetical protein
MIKFLIISNNTERWVELFYNNLDMNNTILRFYKNYIEFKNGAIYIKIINELFENMRGENYNCCILDKYITRYILDNVLSLMIKGSIIKTEKYWEF